MSSSVSIISGASDIESNALLEYDALTPLQLPPMPLTYPGDNSMVPFTLSGISFVGV